MAKPKVTLTVQRLEDRLTPVVDASHPIVLDREYWARSEFIPKQIEASPDGVIWVLGNSHRGLRYSEWGTWDNDWAVVKFNSIWDYDETFNHGRTFLDLNAGPMHGFRILDIETGPDGKLYLLGQNDNPLLPFIRTPAGLPMVVPGEIIDDSVLKPVSYAPTEQFAVARINPDGTFDSTYDFDGVSYFDLNPIWDQPLEWETSDAKFAIGSDGSVAVAATQRPISHPETPEEYRIDVVKLTPLGQPDTTFHEDGFVMFTLFMHNPDTTSYTGQLVGMDFDSNGRLFLGGNALIEGVDASGNVRFTGMFAISVNPDGSGDLDFSEDSLAFIMDYSFGPQYDLSANQFTLDSFGRPLFAGTMRTLPDGISNPPPPEMLTAGFVIRLKTDGSYDQTLDDDGILYPDENDTFDHAASGEAVVPLPDGGFLFVGQDAELLNGQVFTLLRSVKFMEDGTRNTAFFPCLSHDVENVPLAVDVTPDGRMVKTRKDDTSIDASGVGGGNSSHTSNVPDNRWGPWQPNGWLPYGYGVPFRSVAGDFDGDGIDDFAYAIGKGYVTNLRIVGSNGEYLLPSFQPFEARFKGVLYLEAGDFDGDGKDELVVSPDEGGGARIQIFTFANGSLIQRANYFAIKDPNFRGGGSIAAGDMNGDGTPDLAVGAAFGGSQRIATFNGKTLLIKSNFPPVLHRDYFAPLPFIDFRTYRGGVELRSEDANGDGKDEIIMFARVRGNEGNMGIIIYGVAGNLLRYDSLNFWIPEDRDEMLFDLLTGKSKPA